MNARVRIRRSVAWAAGASTVSIALLGIALALSPGTAPKYMGWNLVLAWVPVLLACVLYWCVRRGIPRIGVLVVAVVWLAFLPNAPYLLTDLVHAGTPYGGATRLDVITLLAFAITGLVMFFAAMTPALEAARLAVGDHPARAAVLVCAIVTSLGMYLGRVLRWNSWDLAVRPVARLESAIPFVRTPADIAKAATFVIAIALLLVASRAALDRMALRDRR